MKARQIVLTKTAQSLATEFNSVIIRSVGLCQLVLTGDISDADRLTLASLTEIPASTDRVKYDQYTYVGKLIKKAQEVLHVNQDIKDKILAVDIEDTASLENFQIIAALKGHYITTGAGFDRFLADNLTEETKAARATIKAGKKAEKAAKGQTATAKTSNAAPDSVTVPAASAAAEADSRDVQAHNALVEMMANSDIFAAAIKAASLLTGDQARLALVQAWKKDHAKQQAEIASLKAKLAKATAPRKTKAKPVNPAMAEAMSQATTEALKQALAS